MENFRLGSFFSRGWQLYKNHFGRVLLLMTLLVISCNVLAQGLKQPFGFIFSFVAFYFTFGLMNVCLYIAKDHTPQFSQLFIEARRFLNYLLATFIGVIAGVLVAFAGILLMGLLVGATPHLEKLWNFLFIFFGIVVLLVAMSRLYLLMPFFILERGVGPITSLKMSWNATHGYSVYMFAFIVIAFILYFVGALLFIIGLFVAIPWVLITQALIYRELS